MIYLSLGRLHLDWGKNHGYVDHSCLFQAEDVAQVPYDYVTDDLKTSYSEYRDGMQKPLGLVVDRLHLMGHTLETAEREYAMLADDAAFETALFPFDELKAALLALNIADLTDDRGPGEDFSNYFRRYVPSLVEARNLSGTAYLPEDAEQAVDFLTSHSILVILALNPAASDLPVRWSFADLEEGGWGRREDFARVLRPARRFLIVTEGSSDAAILKHGFSLLRPHVADFFDFVDMQDGYPFSGTGNMFNFLKGLLAISIQNNVVFLFDNDAEGVVSHNKCLGLKLPDNVQILALPDDPRLESFPTIGPNGRHLANINGQAAAIECYLDLGEDAAIQWTGFMKQHDIYQGELIAKTRYMKAFLDQREKQKGYDYAPLEAVLDMIIKACSGAKEYEALWAIEEKIEG